MRLRLKVLMSKPNLVIGGGLDLSAPEVAAGAAMGVFVAVAAAAMAVERDGS